MTYLLDTNIVILILKNQASQGERVAEKLRSMPHDEVAICSVVEAELFHGAEKYGMPERRRQALRTFLAPYAPLPFDSVCVPHYAHIRHLLETRGEIIGAYDLQIAATALAHDLTLVTHNSGEFSRVPNLKVEEWA